MITFEIAFFFVKCKRFSYYKVSDLVLILKNFFCNFAFMNSMSALKYVYKALRSILFTTILLLLGLCAILYITVSLPPVQNYIKTTAEKQLTSLLGGDVKISSVEVFPFDEVRLNGVSIYTPDHMRCISVGRIGAGVSLWSLITDSKIVITYAEIISLNADIWQEKKDSPLNIQFIIDAFKPKDKNRPPTKFDLNIKNVVIRKSNISFHRDWCERHFNSATFDPNYICITNFRADIEFPRIANDHFDIDVRQLAFQEKSGIDVSSISFKTRITAKELLLSSFKLIVNNSDVRISDISLRYNGYQDILRTLQSGDHDLTIESNNLTPASFAFLNPKFGSVSESFRLKATLSGNLENLSVDNFSLHTQSPSLMINVKGNVRHLLDTKSLTADISNFKIDADKDILGFISDTFLESKPEIIKYLKALGDIKAECMGHFSLANRNCAIKSDISTTTGDLTMDGLMIFKDSNSIAGKVKLNSESFNIGKIFEGKKLGTISLEANADISISKDVINGQADLSIPYLEYNGKLIHDIELNVSKNGNSVHGRLLALDKDINVDVTADCLLAKSLSEWNLIADINNLEPGFANINKLPKDLAVKGRVELNATGDNIDNIAGALNISDVHVIANNRIIEFDNISINSAERDGLRCYKLRSPYFDADVKGKFVPSHLIASLQRHGNSAVPLYVKDTTNPICNADESMSFLIKSTHDSELIESLGLPIYPGVPVEIVGLFEGADQKLSIVANAPYLVQGKNKLIKDSRVSIDASRAMPVSVGIHTKYPLKSDVASLSITSDIISDKADVDISWEMVGNENNVGKIGIGVELNKNPLTNGLDLLAQIKKSGFTINRADWNVTPAKVSYKDKQLSVEGLKIWHGLQYVDISGKASEALEDIIDVRLAGIDLEYIFNILNINYVNFGGSATGEVMASRVFSSSPIAQSKRLSVKNLAYNNCVLGDGELESHWNHEQKMVAINADINGADDSFAQVRGGVYVGRDSLGFNFKTRKINIEFLQPFMKGFTSKVTGRATADIQLYGTFADVDLGGWAYADTITMKVDQTNVYYSGSDSVKFSPGRIEIPGMTVYDRFGNHGHLTGKVTHRYLHDAAFDFDLTDARNILCYDTDKSFGDRWYGRVFASGNASIKGLPGYVGIDINMRTSKKTDFIIELDELETAGQYSFLTFSDHKKDSLESIKAEMSFEEAFRRKFIKQEAAARDIFNLNLELDVTTDAAINLIMDPKAGDNIRAYGSGGLRMQYNSASDNFLIYGKYTLARGNYRFSLQDIILKNFKIEEGSSISFNGDPERGVLDISAAYRVNTSLLDLDKSFSSDPDLNRTSVPVDALLKVTGDIRSPEINFDLKMPTVTSDVERKVRSIISTEEMMNRQVIYLLALNRFYAPDYMSAEQGSEFASVASSTLSSQLSNIISNITDKFSLNPSFKSDKSDFSDVEVDVALSSSLFNNRLMVNGNLGYRDRSTSQTTFIGDFDIEYLLTKNGNLRLKAYNHFNDASYYLRSSLTTQGIGLLYRRDFDDLFYFLKRKKRKENEKALDKISKDSIISVIDINNK